MVLSGSLIKIPYWLCWQIRRMTNHLHGVVFYVESTHDYQVMAYILPHIRVPYHLAAKNKKVARSLRQKGLHVLTWPVFPTVLIMARHAFHRFPIKAIRKIGLMHGPYYFKKMISARKYNAFDLYLFTSPNVLKQASERGITCGVVGGYSRIDAFKDPRGTSQARDLKIQAKFSGNKQSLLIAATWDGSGQSAIDRWVDHLDSLAQKYNLLVSLHPMMSAGYVQKVRQARGVYILEQDELYAGMMLADILLCDTSSIIAEFCALDKPIITFLVHDGPRLTPDIMSMISDMSTQINHITELDAAVNCYLEQPDMKRDERQKWRRIMFDDITISHGKKAAQIICEFITGISARSTINTSDSLVCPAVMQQNPRK